MVSLVAVIAFLGMIIFGAPLFKLLKKYICEDLDNYHKSNLCYYAMMFVCSAITFSFSFVDVYNDFSLLKEYSNADEQIATIEQENNEIEDSLYSILQYYIEHERKDLDFEKMDTMSVIESFPELESVTHEKVHHYYENEMNLAVLEVKKEEIPKAKWRLYFGS